MHIGIPTEIRPGEARVAATPETIKKLLVGNHHTVLVQSGAGVAASIPDDYFIQAGAKIVATAKELYAQADMILKVCAPEFSELELLQPKHMVIGILNRFDTEKMDALTKRGITAFALEAAPRITRAQSMDVLSSQANIAGYKAMMMAAHHYGKMIPMMMTAAGTIKAARVVVMGAGVAGLQAIATAKRLGAVIEATDVRPETKEQVESLGAKFIEVPLTDSEKELAKGVGGYAREMGEAYKAKQAALIAEKIKLADIVITTALIPGRSAPQLVTEAMVKTMKPGSVIVDMAAAQGGNCPLTEKDKVIIKHGVLLVGYTNYPAMVAADASALYARNILDFLKLIFNTEGQCVLNKADEIIRACLVCGGT